MPLFANGYLLIGNWAKEPLEGFAPSLFLATSEVPRYLGVSGTEKISFSISTPKELPSRGEREKCCDNEGREDQGELARRHLSLECVAAEKWF
jgi:hypothetical protein